jgi:hypothetical protein
VLRERNNLFTQLCVIEPRGALNVTIPKSNPMIAIQGNRDIPVDPYALLDHFRIFFAKEHGFPGEDMLRLMKIAVGDKRKPLEAYRIKEIVAIR